MTNPTTGKGTATRVMRRRINERVITYCFDAVSVSGRGAATAISEGVNPERDFNDYSYHINQHSGGKV